LKINITPLSTDQYATVAAWLSDHRDNLPEPVSIVLENFGALFAALMHSNHRSSQILAALRRALKITPSSERSQGEGSQDPNNKSGDNPQSVPPPGKRNETPSERSQRLAKWHRDHARRHARNVKRFKDLEMKQKTRIDENDEEFSEEEKAEMQREHEALWERVRTGGGPDPSMQAAKQAFINGNAVLATTRSVCVPAPEHAPSTKLLDTMVDTRVRYDVTLRVERLELGVEKKIIENSAGERSVLCASTEHIGPPRYAVTWGFLVHVVQLVAQYAMPMNRLARLLSTDNKIFSTSYLSRLIQYAAIRLAPIYVELLEGLADSGVLMGDDTPARVLEVNRALKRRDKQPPWSPYRTIADARQNITEHTQNHSRAASLGLVLGSELGFEFGRRLPNGGAKTALNTTAVLGRTVANDPRSLAVIFRTHLGSFGNLLSVLLEMRNPANKEVVVQSDLATSNLVIDPELLQRFQIRWAGCASHARRPYAQHAHEDPELCERMLHHFKGLFIYEQCLNAEGRNEQNTRAVRDIDSRELWERIKEDAELTTVRWSKETKLGKGARYILRHFDKLTAYLDDPRLEPSTNFVERMLRMENLIEASSMFRVSLEGRFALDILRSIAQTTIAANLSLSDYLLDIFRAAPEDVEADPAAFTPLSYARNGRFSAE
jgi:hypothetical protein